MVLSSAVRRSFATTGFTQVATSPGPFVRITTSTGSLLSSASVWDKFALTLQIALLSTHINHNLSIWLNKTEVKIPTNIGQEIADLGNIQQCSGLRVVWLTARNWEREKTHKPQTNFRQSCVNQMAMQTEWNFKDTTTHVPQTNKPLHNYSEEEFS